ncbi:MAG TPA: hypothetical protein VLA29_12525 [Acidimicrobiia bacterium]|nr:hypothetical protein [Acidimicrobiia bacterium]
MKPRAILLIVVAFALGAFAAGSIGVRVIREVRTAEGATSLPPSVTTTSQPQDPVTFQVSPTETIIGSAALVPTTLDSSGSSVAIGYDLVTLAPHAGVESWMAFFVSVGGTEIGDLDHVYPRGWSIDTEGGSFPGGPANPTTRVARFDVEEGFSLSDITDVRITDAVALFPLDVPFTLSQDEPRREIAEGVTVELLNVSDQGTSTIVQVGVSFDPLVFDAVFIDGDGPGWRSAVREAEGRPRFNLTWVGGGIPADIPLVMEAAVWVPLSGEFAVSLEGLR